MNTDMNDILGNEPIERDEELETSGGEEVITNNAGEGDGQDTGTDTTGEESRVAAEEQETGSVKGELSAIRKERERLRVLREENERLNAELTQRLNGTGDGNQAQTADQQQAESGQQVSTENELARLRAEHRNVLADLALDPGDEELAAKADELEEQIDALKFERFQQRQTQQQQESQQQATFAEVHAKVHEDFPFLDPYHPDVDAGLNSRINAMYEGLKLQGMSKTDALKEAVEMFAPARAEQLGMVRTQAEQQQQEQQAGESEKQRLQREKLARQTGFAETRSATSRSGTGFNGPTPMKDILGQSG